MSDNVFVDGMIVKEPHEKAKNFVICKVSFRTDQMIDFLQANDKNGWVNADVKRSQGGKLYASLDNWEPQQQAQPQQPQEPSYNYQQTPGPTPPPLPPDNIPGLGGESDPMGEIPF